VQFLKSRSVIQKALNDKIQDAIDARGIHKPQIALFNDTIVVAIKCDANSKSEETAIAAMGTIARKVIVDGIARKILYRGAIGVGQYFDDLKNNTIIGEAVSDAAAWYESYDMIGCILTPRTELVLRSHRYASLSSPAGLFIEFKVPTKEMRTRMLCVNWPRALYNAQLRPEGCKTTLEAEFLYTKFGGNPLPKYAECKIANSIEFFRASLQRVEGMTPQGI
jgi:hypothetical protein